MGKRDWLFLAACLAVIVGVASSLWRRERVAPPRAGTPAVTRDPSFQATLERVNAEFREQWAAAGLETAPTAEPLTLARRLSLSLTGAVPSLEEIRVLEKVSDDRQLEWWLSHLLEDRRSADYVAERLARAYVGTDMGPFLVYRRRRFVSWLGDRLHRQDLAYDALVRKLLTEEGLWTDAPAVNFVTATSDPNQDNKPDPIKLANRTSRAFLGMRIDCLQCHDDRLEKIHLGDPQAPRTGEQRDFHQLAAFFGDVGNSIAGIRDRPKANGYQYKFLGAENEERVPAKVPFLPKFEFVSVAAAPTDATAPVNPAAFGNPAASGNPAQSRNKVRAGRSANSELREQLADWVTHPDNRPFARAAVNRFWALVFGRPLVEPIDDIPLTGPFPPGLETLADDFIHHGYDVRRLIRLMASTDAFQRDSRAEFEVTAAHERAWSVFPLTRLRPEQVAGAVIQSSSLSTIDGDAHIVRKLMKFGQTNEFVQRYGDTGEDEFADRGGTIPQRLLLMNGELVRERTKEDLVMNAATRIAVLASDASRAVEVAYLTVLTRRPSDEEWKHFTARIEPTRGNARVAALEDLCWTLINSTEFSWNH
jgi:hypothetical protein